VKIVELSISLKKHADLRNGEKLPLGGHPQVVVYYQATENIRTRFAMLHRVDQKNSVNALRAMYRIEGVGGQTCGN